MPQESKSPSADAARAGRAARTPEPPDVARPGWVLLVYRIPTEPTRLRASVWRKLKGLGAIYLQSSVAALPAMVGAERALRALRKEIADMGGIGYLFHVEVLAGESDVVAAFNAARDDEYDEIVDRCEDFLAQVEKEYVANHFSYAELEENDEDLTKLKNWFAKVERRDVLGATGKQATIEALAKCEAKLEEYAGRVYAEEGESR